MAERGKLDRYGRRNVIRELLRAVLQWALLVFGAGTLAWPMGMVLGGWLVVKTITSNLLLGRLAPELLNHRGRAQAGAEKFDIQLLSVIFLFIYAMFPVCGLDHRLASPAPAWWPWLGWPVVLASEALMVWAMAANTHFEGLIRLQTDRNHAVCDTGPYRLVRHPGYLGMIMAIIATPLILRTWWGLIPAGVAVALFFLRTALEDRFLKRELTGYAIFAAKTKSRLIPGIW